MTLKFRPEDFPNTGHIFMNQQVSQIVANKAQQIFDKWLAEQPVVYGSKHPSTNLNDPTKSYIWGHVIGTLNTHKARLVCIEEIKKCEHKPEDVELIQFYQNNNMINEFKCKCGKKVAPNSYKGIGE